MTVANVVAGVIAWTLEAVVVFYAVAHITGVDGWRLAVYFIAGVTVCFPVVAFLAFAGPGQETDEGT